MEITIFIRPEGTGYRATCAAPVPVSIQAPTRDEALAALRREVHEQLRNGEVVQVDVTVAEHPLSRSAGIWKGNPLIEEWQSAVKAYRLEREEDGSAAE